MIIRFGHEEGILGTAKTKRESLNRKVTPGKTPGCLGMNCWHAASHNLNITWSPGTKDLTTFLESRKHSQTLWSSQPKILKIFCYFLPLWKISESLFFPTQGEELPEDMG